MATTITSSVIPSRRQLVVSGQGFITENFDRNDGFATMTANAAKEVNGAMVGLRGGDLITNLHVVTGTTGSGTGYARMGLYSTAGVLLASSGDANSLFTGTAGTLTVPLSAPYTVTADGAYWIAFMTDLSVSQPTVMRAQQLSTVQMAPVGSGNYSIIYKGGQTALPAGPTTFTYNTYKFWVAAS